LSNYSKNHKFSYMQVGAFHLGMLLLFMVLSVLITSCSKKVEEKDKESTNSTKIKIQRVRTAGSGEILNNPFNVLLLGSDSRNESIEGRSDSIMIIHVNPQEHSAFLISFPRDSRVSIPGHGTNKINAAMSYGGPSLTAKTIENLTGIKIDYIATTTFFGFTRMINNLGGVQITLEDSIKDPWAGANLKAGGQTLTGEQALAFSRSRHIPNGDFARASHQQDVVVAVFDQEREKQQPQDILKLINIFMNDCETNLTYPEIFRFINIAFNIKPENVTKKVLKGNTGTVGGASYVILNQKDLNKTFQSIKASDEEGSDE